MSTTIEDGRGRVVTIDEKSKRPVLSRTTVAGLVGSVLTLLVAFGVDLSPLQQAAIIGFAVTATAVAGGIWAQRKAWSPRSVAELLARQQVK